MEPIIYTPYSKEQILLAFQRALNDLTDAEIFALRDQEAEARTADVSTLSQAIAAINADLAANYVRSTVLDAEAADRSAADGKQCAALTALLDSGAKNLLSVTSGSNTLPTRWIQIPVRVQPGTYRITLGSLVSDDTDSTTCQCIGFSAENVQVTNTMQLARGTGISGVMTVTGEVAYIRIYSADRYAYGEGDTVTFTDGMLCAEAAHEITPEFVPYRPSWDEMWEAIQALQQNRGAFVRAADPQINEADLPPETEDADARDPDYRAE